MSKESADAPAVAVVVVHGVADQKPSESARQIANLLTDLCPLGTYSTFVEEEIRVPVEPVRPVRQPRPVKSGPFARRRWFEERNPDVIRRHSGVTPGEPAGVTFMRDQLRDYSPSGPSVFETVRLRGRHNESGRDVDVFEAYWADLSRPANSLLSFFAQVYQLLLHLPSVGRTAVDYARAAYKGRRGWAAFSWVHRWAVRCLTLFIVTLNLALAALIPPLVVPLVVQSDARLVGETSPVLADLKHMGVGQEARLAVAAPFLEFHWTTARQVLPWALLGLLPVAVAVWVMSRMRRGEPRGWRLTRFAVALVALAEVAAVVQVCRLSIRGNYSEWPAMGELLPVVVLGLGALAGAGWLVRRAPLVRPEVWGLAPVLSTLLALIAGVALAGTYGSVWLLTVEACVISALVVDWILRAYDRMRPGAHAIGRVWLGVLGLVLLYGLRLPPVGGLVEQRGALVHAVMVPLQLVNIGLAAFWRAHVAVMLVTVWVGLLCAWRAPREEPAAWRTLWTASTSLALSTALFANVTLAVWSALFTAVARLLDGSVEVTALRLPAWLAAWLRLPLSAGTIGEYVRQTLATSASSAFILISLVLGIFLLVALWSILPSIWIEAFPPSNVDADGRRSRGLGSWLSRGLNVIPSAAWTFTLLFVGLVVIYALEMIVSDDTAWKAVSAAGVVLLGLLGARIWLPGASKSLDLILDVDNYLRQHPKGDTPRARMAARQASLLRFLVTPARCGRRYDRIVIIAHSQGTVITADLLRYLKRRVPALSQSLSDRRVALFTMGSPLAQLYARAFPWLYEWVWSGAGVAPAPAELGVTRWVNAYRSGDYIGRQFWRDGTDGQSWLRRRQDPQDVEAPDVATFAEGRCLEMCLGEGAHTHYWDQHGRDVAWQLNRLIVEDDGVPAGQCRIPEP